MTYSVLIRMKGEAAEENNLIRAAELINFAATSTENISKQDGFPQLLVIFGGIEGGHSFPFCKSNEAIQIESINDKIRMFEPRLTNLVLGAKKDDLEDLLDQEIQDSGKLGSHNRLLYTKKYTENTYQIHGNYRIVNDTFEVEFIVYKGDKTISDATTITESNKKKLVVLIKNTAIKDIEKFIKNENSMN